MVERANIDVTRCPLLALCALDAAALLLVLTVLYLLI